MADDELPNDSRTKLDFAFAELARQESDYSSRAASMNARATLLVAASSIAAGLQVAGLDLWTVLGGLAAGTSAVLGVFALLPRRGDVIDIEAYERDTFESSPYEALRYLVFGRLRILRDGEAALAKRAGIVRVGSAFLASAAVLAAVHLLSAAIPEASYVLID